MPLERQPRSLHLDASVLLALAALAATVVAVLRYRATELIIAKFDRPLSMGGSEVIMYQSDRHWYERFQLWLALALLLALAAILLRLARAGRRVG